MVIAGAILALIVLWSAIAGTLIVSRQSAIDAEQRVLKRMSTVVEEEIHNRFSSIRFFLTNADRISTQNPHADPRTDPEFLNLLKAFYQHSTGLLNIRLAATNGDVYPIPSPDRKPIANVADRDYFLAQSVPSLHGFHVGKPVQNRTDKRWSIPISYPLSSQPHGISMVLASIDIRNLETLYEQARTKPQGSIALVLRNGTVLARAPAGEKSVGKSIANGKIWQEFLPQSPQGFAILPEPAIGDGQTRLAAYSALPDFPLVVIASSSLDDVLVTWHRWLYGGLLTGLMLSLLTVIGARRLTFLLTALAKTRTEVEDQAQRDFLTGLPNRRSFHESLEHEIKKTDRSARSLAVLFIDLDLFKEINDTLGHGMGDRLLIEAAHRLHSCIRASDTIARMGGDEFTVILCDLTDIYSGERVAQSILESLAEPFTLNGEIVYISASIGITLYPQDAIGIEDLIKNADQAMYAAKDEGRNRWKYFTQSMQVVAQNRKRMRDELRIALAGNQFRVYYQPIVDLHTGDIIKAEALIRWQHPTRGLVGPVEFIPILEEMGLIIDIGNWVFREAALQVARWRESIHPEFQISVNKSPVQFKHIGSHEDWGDYLNSLGLPGNSITVEITEGLLLDASDTVKAKLRDLDAAGIQLSLDDFGTGYSALSYLKKFDIDFIKIDRSFVSNLESSSDDLVLCEAIVMMAHKLGLKVIAEGVESEGQRDILGAIGCDYAQGYLYSRPVPADEFEKLIPRDHVSDVTDSHESLRYTENYSQ